jgi:hypothetical protein
MNMTRLALVAAVALALTACGKTEDHDQAVATGPAPAESVAQAAPSTPESAPMSVVETPVRIASLASKTTDCNLENVNGAALEGDAPSVPRNAPVTVAGWLVDVAAGAVPSKARLRLENADGTSAWEQPISEWGDRPDIVAAKGNNAAFQKSGFTTTMQVGALPPGTYAIYLAYDASAGESACAVGRHITLD